jgi:methylated-DNA-[protein]-cysteine S-methyltransferase
MGSGYTEFETAIGRCGIAWGQRGIVGVRLPGGGAAPKVSGSPPRAVREAIEGINRLLGGESVDLSWVELDFEHVPELRRRVYDVARTIQPGSTLTYGEIARRLGDPHLSREVGQALARNPFPIVVPCHRVVASNGKLGGFSAPGGSKTKMRMLAIEGAATQPMFS